MASPNIEIMLKIRKRLLQYYSKDKMSVFGVFLVRIQSKCWKIRTRKAMDTDTFHVVSEILQPYP